MKSEQPLAVPLQVPIEGEPGEVVGVGGAVGVVVAVGDVAVDVVVVVGNGPPDDDDVPPGSTAPPHATDAAATAKVTNTSAGDPGARAFIGREQEQPTRQRDAPKTPAKQQDLGFVRVPR